MGAGGRPVCLDSRRMCIKVTDLSGKITPSGMNSDLARPTGRAPQLSWMALAHRPAHPGPVNARSPAVPQVFHTGKVGPRPAPASGYGAMRACVPALRIQPAASQRARCRSGDARRHPASACRTSRQEGCAGATRRGRRTRRRPCLAAPAHIGGVLRHLRASPRGSVVGSSTSHRSGRPVAASLFPLLPMRRALRLRSSQPPDRQLLVEPPYLVGSGPGRSDSNRRCAVSSLPKTSSVEKLSL